MIGAEDDWFGPVVEVYEDTEHLGTIAFHFDHTSPAYFFLSSDKRTTRYLCWQEDEEIAVARFKRRYYAALRREGVY